MERFTVSVEDIAKYIDSLKGVFITSASSDHDEDEYIPTLSDISDLRGTITLFDVDMDVDIVNRDGLLAHIDDYVDTDLHRFVVCFNQKDLRHKGVYEALRQRLPEKAFHERS